MTEPSSAMLTFIVRAMNAKADLLKAGETGGQFDCPKCGSKAKVWVVGGRKHARAACSTKNCLSLIE